MTRSPPLFPSFACAFPSPAVPSLLSHGGRDKQNKTLASRTEGAVTTQQRRVRDMPPSKKKGDESPADRLDRIALVSADRCKPKKCRQECKKSCPVVKIGAFFLFFCVESLACKTWLTRIFRSCAVACSVLHAW